MLPGHARGATAREPNAHGGRIEAPIPAPAPPPRRGDAPGAGSVEGSKTCTRCDEPHGESGKLCGACKLKARIKQRVRRGMPRAEAETAPWMPQEERGRKGGITNADRRGFRARRLEPKRSPEEILAQRRRAAAAATAARMAMPADKKLALYQAIAAKAWVTKRSKGADGAGRPS